MASTQRNAARTYLAKNRRVWPTFYPPLEPIAAWSAIAGSKSEIKDCKQLVSIPVRPITLQLTFPRQGDRAMLRQEINAPCFPLNDTKRTVPTPSSCCQACVPAPQACLSQIYASPRPQFQSQQPLPFTSLLHTGCSVYLFLPIFRISTPPMTPAATASPLTIATPTSPSLATLSSISVRRLLACRFAGSFSSSRSLYRRASA